MHLNAKQLDRAVGALLGAAAGDALGVPYEAGLAPLGADEPARMIGGGIGRIAPGRWSDDTEMACCISEVAATGADLRSPEALDQIADGFLRWYAMGPPDVGIQTGEVLGGTSPGAGAAGRMSAVSEALHRRSGKTAGNGSLMRTSPVALAHLGDADAIEAAARAISALTHWDPSAGDACVLWSLAIDHAIRTGELDVRVGLDRVDPAWAARIEEAERELPRFFAHNNGWVVSALQGAWSSIVHSSSLEEGLQLAVHGGHDTDTVAAIAGGLLGAAYGGSAVPARWRRMIFGWPYDMRARDLTRLAVLAAKGGKPDADGWPSAATIPSYADASTVVVQHPDDPGVLLGAVGALRPGVADAVVSLCRLGRDQAPVTKDPADHIEVWMVDQDDANNNLPWVLADTAAVIKQLRDEGKTVFLHCVHAMTRTPVVAAAYGMMIAGGNPPQALNRVAHRLPSTRPRPSIALALRAQSPASPRFGGSRARESLLDRRREASRRDALIDRFVKPFYLHMMITNATAHPETVAAVRAMGEHVSPRDVRHLLRDGFRPRAMGAWYAVMCRRGDVREEVLEALTTSRGYLDSPPLATASVALAGPGALWALELYHLRDTANGGTVTVGQQPPSTTCGSPSVLVPTCLPPTRRREKSSPRCSP